VLDEPLSPAGAEALVRAILERGTYVVSQHALEEMDRDDLATVDCINVLRAGVFEVAGCERGTWRYRARTHQITVVIGFRSSAELVVITAWRQRKGR
jgi:hypothetical protein